MSGSLDDAFRHGKSASKLVAAIANGSKQLVGKSEKRIAIHIYPTGDDQLIYVSDRTATAAQQGPHSHCDPATSNGPQPISFTQWTHGDYATNEFHVWSTTADAVFVVEVFGDCSCETGH